MKVCVLNGSPKGKYSCTIQTILFLKKYFHEDCFEIFDIASKIKYYEKNMEDISVSIKTADIIIFSYPVYTFIAPSQMHRFIEILKEQKLDLGEKFSTQITTSKHFYDVTAHQYIEDNCFDLGLKVIHGLSADMDDLLSKEGQKDAIKFYKYVRYCVQNNIYEINNQKIIEPFKYTHGLLKTSKKDGQDIVIVTDLSINDTMLSHMIEDFRNIYPYETRVVNIREYPFIGGCLGCFNCAGDGKCIYKDGFDSFLRTNIQNADGVVYAFTIKDHSMGSRFKMYDDRQFCNGHRTVTEGKPFGYIVNGHIEMESNLKLIIQGRCEVGHNFLAGIANDKESIVSLSKRLDYAIKNRYLQPRNFLGVGGMKIFRDLIWLMRGLMKADHQYYKKHGIYDFPQKHRLQMIKMCLVGSLVRNKKIKVKMGNKMNEAIIKPYQAVINALEKNN